jgi:PTS system mannose-specific IIC component
VSAADLVLLVWGTLVGLDLVSVPQMMIARPLVAGTIAGALLGDVATGLRIGVVFELFQFDILPVGAVRYPEYGPASVAAVAAAHWSGGPLATGIGAGVGLLVGLLGGMSLHWLRSANARAVHAASAALESGDVRALGRVHLGGLLRDAGRACAVTAAGLAAARLLPSLGVAALPPAALAFAAAAAAGAALASGGAGLPRLVGRGHYLKWLVAGLAGGVVVSWVR